MCSIIGSFSKKKITELVEVNQHRGKFAYSILAYNTMNNKIFQIYKDFGVFSLDNIKEMPNIYYICHLQSPTGGIEIDVNRTHPTMYNDTYLFHNGILKQRAIDKLQFTYNTNITFDTKLLHMSLTSWNNLNDIEGLFACLYIKNENINIFRSKHSKLYIDKDLNISSEKFPDSKCINYDTIYKLNFKNNNLIAIDTFKTKRYNIIIEGEL